MEYKGKLYAKIGGKYIPISHTDDFEALESKAQRLQDNIVAYQNEICVLKLQKGKKRC